MFLVFHCPTCHQPSQFPVGELGKVTRCPRCHNWMTLPHQAPPVASSDLSALDPGIGRIIQPLSSHSPPGFGGVLMIGLIAVLIVASFVVGGWLIIERQMRPSVVEVHDGRKKAAVAKEVSKAVVGTVKPVAKGKAWELASHKRADQLLKDEKKLIYL